MSNISKQCVIVLCAACVLLPSLGWAAQGGGGLPWETAVQSILDSVLFMATAAAVVGLLIAGALILLSFSPGFAIVVGLLIGLGIIGGRDIILGLFGLTSAALL